MASSDIKHDYNMEAGLLSTQGEERMLTKEAQFQDSELANSRDDTRTTSCARRALIALAVVCLVGVGLVSLGGGVCPGHLRHAVNGEISVKDAIHSHKPNLSDSMAQLARRQDNLTPGASSSTGSGDSSTASEPTAGPTDASTTDQPSDTAAQSTSTQPEASQTSDTNQPSSTAAQESTSQEASTSSEDTPSSTEQRSSAAATTSNAPSSTAVETTAESQSSSQAESTTDSGTSTSEAEPSATSSSSPSETASISSSITDQASSTTADSTKEKTITTGTRTTSSAVKKTFTATLENGGITTLTSTSWVQVVPNSQSTSASDASLQNAASQSSVSGILSAVISMIFGGLLLL